MAKMNPSSEGDTRRCLLYVITKLGIGGAESQVRDLACAFSDRGWRVVVASLRDADAHVEVLQSHGVQVVNLGLDHSTSLLSALKNYRRLIRELKPTCVHTHCYHANVFCRLAQGRKRSYRLICTAHSVTESSQKYGKSSLGLRDRIYSLTDRRSDYNTHVSQVGLKRYRQHRLFGSTPSEWIPNGINLLSRAQPENVDRLRNRFGWKKDEFIWLHVGRLTMAKNQKILIDAFGEVLRSYDHSRLIMAGDGSLKADLQYQIRSLGLEAKIDMLGARSDVTELMQAANAFILTSDWEGLPITVLEAGSLELPIVATDVGDIGNLIQADGFIVQPGDKVAIINAMLEMAKSPETQIRNITRSLRERIASDYSLDHIVEKWESLYMSG